MSPGGSPSGLPAGATLLTVALLVMAPVLPAPTVRALGRACSEGPAHLWGLWVARDGLWTHGPLVRDAAVGLPGHFRHHLIDPVHLLVFAPVMALFGDDSATGAVVAWNLVHLGALLTAGLGSMALGRRLGLRGWALGLLVACVAGSAAMVHHPEQGRTEYLPAAGLPLLLAGLWDRCHAPRPDGARTAAALAGLVAGLTALSGPTLSLFTAPVVAVFAATWTRGQPPADRLRRLAPVLLPGLAGAAVALAALWAWPPPHAPAMLSGQPRELVNSAELAALVGLGPPMRDLEHTLYLGMLALPLALFGLVRAPRRLAPWAAVALGLVLLGLGPAPTLLGRPLAGPVAGLTALVPPLGAVSGWPRAAWALALPLGVCAAVGAEALGRHLRWLGPLLIVGILTDHARFPPPRGPDRGSAWFAPAPPAELAAVVAALPPGPLFTLPATTPAAGVACAPDAPWLLWGQALGRPVTANQGQPSDGLATTGWLAAGIVRSPQRLLRQGGRGQIAPGCLHTELARLDALGIAAIVVDERLPRGDLSRQALDALLGPPPIQRGAVAAWPVAAALAAHPGPPAACPPS